MFSVEDFDFNKVGSAGLGSGGQPAGDLEASERKLAHHAGDDDEGKQHPEHEV